MLQSGVCGMGVIVSHRAVIGGRLRALPWWGQCALLWLALVVGLSAVGLVGAQALDLSQSSSGRYVKVRDGYDRVVGVPPGSLPGIWARWDSPYYYNIARDGYAAHPYAMGFLPLYPLN